MPGPSLSRIERERIATAAKLEAAGSKVHWRRVFPELSFTADGKRPKDDGIVFTQQTRPVYETLCNQAAALYRIELDKAHVEHQRVSQQSQGKDAAGSSRHVAVQEIPDVRGVETVRDLRTENAGGAHEERRNAAERSGLDVCAALSDASFAAGRAGADAGENLAPAV
jgi:hypothetical protein